MSALKPDSVNSHDLGTSSLPWKELHVDQITMGARAGNTTLTLGTADLLTAGDPVNLVVHGSLTVNGNTTTLSSTELVIQDKTITLADGSADSAAADGAGITVDGASATLLYSHAGTQWEFNKPLEVQGNVLPQADDSFTLGSQSLAWADVFVTDGGTVSFANATGDGVDLSLTHSTGALTLNSSSKLQFNDASSYIRHNGTALEVVDDATITVSAGGRFYVDAEQNVELDTATGIVALQDNASNKLVFDLSVGVDNDVVIRNGSDGLDIVFSMDEGATEIMRLDDSASSLLIAGSNKIEFADANAYIHHDGTDLKLADDADINLVAGTDILLDAASLVRVDGAIVPHTANGGSLGTEDLEWSDLFLADGGIIKLGNDQDVTLTHVADTGVLLNLDRQLQFGDAGTYLQQSAVGVLKASADGAQAQALQLVASDVAGGVLVDAGTGGVHIDSEGRFLAEASGVASKIELATGGSDSIDLTLSVVGGGDSSLLLSSAGTGSDAVGISASAGGVDVDASGAVVVESSTSITLGRAGGATEKPMTLNATTFDVNGTGALTMSSTSMALDPSTTFDLDAVGAITIDGATVSVGSDGDTGAISLSSDSANVTLQTTTSGKVHLNSVTNVDIDAPTGVTVDTTGAAADIVLDAQAGSILVDGGEAAADAVKLHASNAAGGIVVVSGSEGVDLDATGLVSLTSSKNDPSAIELIASAGGIDITATGEDIDITATGSSVNISATEAVADAITISASTGAGGIDVNAGSSGFDLDSTGQVALTASKSAADAIVIEATDALGGIDLSAGGSVAVSIDVDSVNIDRDVNITGTTPTLTIGDAGAEDASLVFNGNTVDFHIGLDDSEAKLSIGLGTELGAIPNMTLNSADRDVTFAGDIEVQGGKITLTNGATIDSETVGELILTEDLVKTSGNLTVLGNLTVQGDTTTVNTATLDVEDKNVTLNKGGAAASAAGAGINFEEDSLVTGYIRVADDDRANIDIKAPNGSELKLDINSDATFVVGAGLTIESAAVLNQDLTTDAAVTFGSVDADGGVTVDNLTLDGTSLALSAGDFTLDVAGNIVLDADGGSLSFADAGTSLLSVSNNTSDVVIKPTQTDKDIIFQEDGGTEIARFDSDAESLLVASYKKLMLGAAEEFVYGDGTDIHVGVGVGGDVNLPANIGLTFGDDGEKIEGNGTDLTITGGDINLTAEADVNLPANIGLTFGDDGEKIEGDGTDLTLSSGGDINLTATSAIVIPEGVALNFNGLDLGEVAIDADLNGLHLHSPATKSVIIEDTADSLRPSSNSTVELGASATPWSKLYADDIELNGAGKVLLKGTSAAIYSDADNVINLQTANTTRLVLEDFDGSPTAFYPHSPEASPVTLGTATNQFEGLFLYQGKAIDFRDNLDEQDVTLTHVVNEGLNIKNHTGAAATLTLQNSDSDIALNDVLGVLAFQAPNEGTGTDAIEVAAAIAAVSEGDFAADSNATKLSFRTGASEAATEKMSLSSAGVLTLGSAGLVIPNNQTIGSASATSAITINTSGDIALASTTDSSTSTTGALKVAGGLGVNGTLNTQRLTVPTGNAEDLITKGLNISIRNSDGDAQNAVISASGGAQFSTLTVTGSVNFDNGVTLGNASTDITTVKGFLNTEGTTTVKGALKYDSTELTISSGSVTATKPYHKIDGEGDLSDNLVTINGGSTGMILVIQAQDAARTITVEHGTGNIQLNGAANFALDNVVNTLSLIYNGTNWCEIGRADI